MIEEYSLIKKWETWENRLNSGQKTAVSLVLTAGLFVAFIFTYYTNLFTKIETQFYEPERISQARSSLSKTSDFCNSYIQNILDDLGDGYVKESSVKSFLSQTPSESEVQSRVQLSGELFSKYSGLEGFRLIDKNGRDIHYSSYAEDVLKQNGTTRVYKNYSDVQKVSGEISFDAISIPESDNIPSSKVTFNSEKSLINLSFPFYDKYTVFRGTFVFNFRTSDLERELIKSNQISVSDTLTLFASDDSLTGGFVIGMPKVGREFFPEPVLQSWKSKSSGPDKIVEADDNTFWVVLSDYNSKYISVSQAYHSDYFELPADTRILICVCVFITVFLLLFLLLSFKHDDMVVIRSRIKKIQFALISEYIDNKHNVDWAKVSQQIEGRKADLFSDVKKSLGHKGKKHAKEVDALLNKSWEEILSAVGTKQEHHAAIGDTNSAEIKRMLEEVLSTTQLQVQNVQTVQTVAQSPASESPRPVSPRPAAPAAPIADKVEELDEAETLEDAEPVDEVEELDEVESLEDAEPLDEVEELDEVESLEDAEVVAEIEEVASAEEFEPVEEATDIEEFSIEDFGVFEETPEEVQKQKERDELFAEKLEFGFVDSVKETGEGEEQELFEISNPDFGMEHEVEQIEHRTMFSMTSFGDNTSNAVELSEATDTIVEVNGIYSIADKLEISKVNIDEDFKKLVDSVLSV